MIGYGWDMGAGGWMWMVGGLVLVVGVVILALRAMRGVDSANGGRMNSGPRPDPVEILRERFARGEITEAEFEQAQRVLRGGG